MYSRMLNKNTEPSLTDIKKYLGAKSAKRLQGLEEKLHQFFDLKKELRFPFGSDYGWGYKYSHKNKHLCYAFFEEGAFTVMLQIGDKSVPKVESAIKSLLPKTKDLWKHRYPCGKAGGWIHYRILNDTELNDMVALIRQK